MPLLRRPRSEAPQPPPAPGPPARFGALLEEDALRRALADELARTHRYGRPLSALRITGYLLPHERLTPAEHQLVRECLAAELRSTDRAGAMADGSYVAVLPETGEAPAHAVAQRLRAELSLRSAGTQRRDWLVGVVVCTADHDSVDAVLVEALGAALRSRGRRAA